VQGLRLPSRPEVDVVSRAPATIGEALLRTGDRTHSGPLKGVRGVLEEGCACSSETTERCYICRDFLPNTYGRRRRDHIDADLSPVPVDEVPY